MSEQGVERVMQEAIEEALADGDTRSAEYAESLLEAIREEAKAMSEPPAEEQESRWLVGISDLEAAYQKRQRYLEMEPRAADEVSGSQVQIAAIATCERLEALLEAVQPPRPRKPSPLDRRVRDAQP